MKETKKEIIVLLLFLLFTVFSFRSYFVNGLVPFPGNLLVAFYEPWASYREEGYGAGVAHKPIGFDNLRIFYPLRTLTIDEMKNFSWPLWNPYSFSGNTQLATYQSAVFHPLSFLFFLLPQIDAWSLIVILGPFLSSAFMYFFLKELTLGRKAAFFGAIVFAFSAFSLVWAEESFMSVYSALFLPLAMLGFEKILKGTIRIGFVLLTVALAFSLLSGWFQMTFYVWLFIAVWIGIRRKKKSDILIGLLSFFVALCICGIHLIPSIEAYSYSARGTTDAKFIFDNYLLPLWHLATFLVPDFFGNPGSYNYFGSGFYYEKAMSIGIIPFIFLLYALFSLRKKNLSLEKFFAISWLVTFSLGFALPTSWLLLYYLKLPLVSTILPTRIFFLATFCSSVLSAFGMKHYLETRISKKSMLMISGLLVIASLSLWGYVLYYKYAGFTDRFSQNVALISLRNLLLPTVFSIVGITLIWLSIFREKLKEKIYVIFVTLTLISGFYFVNKYFYFSSRSHVFPNVAVLSQLQNITGIDRFWSFGKGYIERNFATQYKLSSAEGYDSFYIRRYGELLNSAQNHGVLTDQIPRTDATFLYADKTSDIMQDRYRKRLLSLLGVKYIVGKREVIDKEQAATLPFELKPIWEDKLYAIYEYTKANPRIFFANDYRVIKERQQILDFLFDEKTDLEKTIVLESEPKGFTLSESGIGTIKNITYKPNDIVIEVEASKPSLLFLSDNYYPGWKAYVDNKLTEIYRADYSFRAIVVPEGTHAVKFEYRPTAFSIGILTSLFGLLLFLLITAKMPRKP